MLADMRHDVFHLAEYQRFASRWEEPGELLAFVAEEPGYRFFVPLIVRPIPVEIAGCEGLFDATSARLYPGPLVSAPIAHGLDGFARRAIEVFLRGMRRRAIVAAFIRLHPLFSPPSDALLRAGPIVDHGDSVSIDLSLASDALWRQTRENHRRDIRAARSKGYGVRIDETWGRLSRFVEIYRQSMDRLGVSAYWRLSAEYFADLQHSLGERVHLCVAELESELAAAALLTDVDGIVGYHLAGTADAHVAASPSKLIIDFARSWARERGKRTLHLAGSLRRGDALNRFKTGFSPLQHPVRSWRVVADATRYGALVERWRSKTGVGPDSAEGYFPAYRKPVPHSA